MAARARLAAAAPAMLGALAVAGAVWGLTWAVVPPLPGMADTAARLALALKLVCLAVLLTFATGLEAVSHERLATDAFDPLSGPESRRLRVNLRYLQNTLEQLALFVPGLLGLAVYSEDGGAMRAVVAVTVVWVLARLAFWIGYHLGPQHRVAGLVGAAQSLVVLLYVAARLGHEVAGAAGAGAVLATFALAEAVLVRLVTR